MARKVKSALKRKKQKRNKRLENLVDILQFINSDGIGAVSFYKYLEKFGSVRAALESLDSKKRKFSKTQAEDEIAKAKKKNLSSMKPMRN
jgi:hypothetical protein